LRENAVSDEALSRPPQPLRRPEQAPSLPQTRQPQPRQRDGQQDKHLRSVQQRSNQDDVLRTVIDVSLSSDEESSPPRQSSGPADTGQPLHVDRDEEATRHELSDLMNEALLPRVGNVAMIAVSRSQIRDSFSAAARGDRSFMASVQSGEYFTAKTAGTRGRFLGAEHIAGGRKFVAARINTSKTREVDREVDNFGGRHDADELDEEVIKGLLQCLVLSCGPIR
jgi:hypothetical protein